MLRMILFLLTAATLSAGALGAEKGTTGGDLLRMDRGAVILAYTGQYNEQFPASAIIDGRLRDYWASSAHDLAGVQPDSFIIELRRTYRLRTLVVDNRQDDEEQYPGVSAKEVKFYASIQSHKGPWKVITVVKGKPFARTEKQLDKPVAARWLKVEVLSNHGNPSYTEITELEAYGDPVGKEPPPVDPDGVYQTNYGPLFLQVKGNRVEGCYELDKGYVYGTTDGRVFNLNWIEHHGEEKGTAVLVLSSTRFLNGLWYEEGDLSGTWFGNKLKQGSSIGCDPITAAAGVGFNGGELAAGVQ